MKHIFLALIFFEEPPASIFSHNLRSQNPSAPRFLKNSSATETQTMKLGNIKLNQHPHPPNARFKFCYLIRRNGSISGPNKSKPIDEENNAAENWLGKAIICLKKDFHCSKWVPLHFLFLLFRTPHFVDLRLRCLQIFKLKEDVIFRGLALLPR